MGPLIKLYQAEVDTLTNRARAAEKAFMEIYKALHHTIDPVPALTKAVDKESESDMNDDDRRRLQTEVEELREELGALQNQDITIRELQQRVLSFESEMEERVREGTILRFDPLSLACVCR